MPGESLDARDEREVWDAVVDMVLDATEEVLDGAHADVTKTVRRELHRYTKSKPAERPAPSGTRLRDREDAMTRELRTDLGVEVEVFVFVDREGERRMTIRVRDIFGSHVSVEDSSAAVAQLLADAAETLAQHERLVRIGAEVRCAECERVTLNEGRCVVCGMEPLCPYCIGAREHDCVRAGEVDG